MNDETEETPLEETTPFYVSIAKEFVSTAAIMAGGLAGAVVFAHAKTKLDERKARKAVNVTPVTE